MQYDTILIFRNIKESCFIMFYEIISVQIVLKNRPEGSHNNTIREVPKKMHSRGQ